MIVTREATANDAKFLFDLANEPLVRAMSFQTDPIPWETHVAWLEGVLADPDRRLWVHETWDGVTMATTRLEVCGRHVRCRSRSTRTIGNRDGRTSSSWGCADALGCRCWRRSNRRT